MGRLRERGQALVETALAAPLLLLLTLGLLQLGDLFWLRVRLQAAAQDAARAYTVWQPQDSRVALAKAEEAAWIALRPQPRGAVMALRVEAPRLQSARYSDRQDVWLHGSLAHALTLRLQLPPGPVLRWVWPRGLAFEAPVSILSEDSVERYAADH